jgi:lycopene cyclase CruA
MPPAAPANTAAARRDHPPAAPDLAHFRRHYPLTVANFGRLPDREAWLRRVWDADALWRALSEGHDAGREAIVRGAPPASLAAEGEFEIAYACRGAGLLHAALLARGHKRRVLVLAVGGTGVGESAARDWNVSEEDLRALERTGLLTREEIESAVLNRYRAGLVKFHDAASRVKAAPLWLEGVLDVSVDSSLLLALAAGKLRASEGCAVVEGARFVRAYVERDRVSIEAIDARGARRLFAARLFVDASGADSAVARQLNGGRAATHVCPTVGTVARGFARAGDGGGGPGVDFGVGEILVSTEDASAHRQLIWEGFGGDARRDEYATHLFFYDAADSRADQSLLALYERYFEKLPRYKRAGAHWRVVRPVFGHAASFRPEGWKARGAGAAAADRVLLACDAAGRTNPLAAAAAGAHLRSLRRSAHLVDLALAADLLDARSLSEIGAAGRGVAQAAGLADFLRPARQGDPAVVNETLNAVMAALGDLDERVRRELFQDRMTFSAFRSLLARTVQLYPRILQRVREQFGARGTAWRLARVAEAAFTERRAGRAGEDSAPSPSRPGDDGGEPAREFARHLALYKGKRGADG